MQAHPLSSTAAGRSTEVPPLAGRVKQRMPFPAPPPGGEAESPDGLAHDARNLMQAVRLYAELLRRAGVLKPEHQHYARELAQLARASAGLMERLVVAAERCGGADEKRDGCDGRVHCVPVVGAGAGSAVENGVDADEMLRSVTPLLHGVAWNTARVSVVSEMGLGCLPLGREASERVLMNLVRNSAQAIAGMQPPGGGEIRISLSADRGRVKLCVEDDGPGMAPESAAGLAGLAALPRTRRGRGLGLRIVRELVSASGGSIAVDRGVFGGAVVTLAWPRDSVDCRGEPTESRHWMECAEAVGPERMGRVGSETGSRIEGALARC